MRCSREKSGFSLMEVNLAILLLALGLLAIFALFPAGLRESELGIADTQEAMFADTILSIMEGNAMTITNWTIWADMDGGSGDIPTKGFRKEVKKGLPYGVEAQTENAVCDPPITFPDGTDYAIQYKISFSGNDNEKTRTVTMWVKYGRYGDFNKARIYTSKFVYLGM